MKSRNATFSLLIVFIFLLFFLLKRWQEPVAKEAFNRHPVHLTYTANANCYMQCVNVDSPEVVEIIERGIIHLNRSDPGRRPCPIFALQGKTGKGKSLRVMVAQCKDETQVLACYSLQKNFVCNCPVESSRK